MAELTEQEKKHQKLVQKILDNLLDHTHQDAFLALSDAMLKVVGNEFENKLSTVQASDIMLSRIQELRDYEAKSLIVTPTLIVPPKA